MHSNTYNILCISSPGNMRGKSTFFTLSLDCELTYPFDENATTLTIFKPAYWRIWIR